MHKRRVWDSDRKVTSAAIGNGTRIAAEGSTLILVRGMSLLNEIRICHAMRDVTFNQDVKGLVARPGIDPLFLTYSLQARETELLHLVHLAGHGTGVLSTDRLKSFLIGVPCDDEQRRIVGFLTSLDDLIQAEESIAEDLDLLIRVAGQWYLNSVASHNVRPLTEVAEITRGFSYKTTELVQGRGWLVNLKNVGRDGTFQPDGYKPFDGTPKPSQIVSDGEIVVAHTDLTQNRAVIGRPLRVLRSGRIGDLVVSLDLAIVRPRPEITTEFLFAALDSHDFRSHALSFCNGTTVLHMSAAALPTYSIPVPDQESLTKFSAEVSALYDTAEDARNNARRLISVRDELLPLLMSGRVRVGASEPLTQEGAA